MAEFGILEGLSGDLQYDQRINDARYQNLQMERSKAKSAANASLFADEYSQGAIGSQYDDAIIKDYTKKKMLEAGNIMKNDPNYKYNPETLGVLKGIKNEIKGNEYVQKATAYVEAKKRFKEDLAELAKNPQMHDQEAYQQLINQFSNYDKFGNQFGEEGFGKEGHQTFVYQKPRDFIDLSSDFHKTGKGIEDFQVIKPKDGNSGEYWTAPTEKALNVAVQSKLQEHGRQIDVETKKLGLTTPEEKYNWVKDNVLAGFNKEYHLGDPDAAFNKAMRLKEFNLSQDKAQAKNFSNSYTPWDYLTDPKTKAGTVSVDNIRKVFNDKPHIVVTGNSGQKADLTGFDFDYDGRFIQRNGIPLLLGNVKVPYDVAKQKGIVGKNTVTGGSDRISSEYIGKAVIVPNKNDKGESNSYVLISYQIPVNPKDQGAKQRYNSLTDVDKLVPASQNPYQSNQNTYEGSVNDFKSAGWNDSQIKEGVQKGIIKIK